MKARWSCSMTSSMAATGGWSVLEEVVDGGSGGLAHPRRRARLTEDGGLPIAGDGRPERQTLERDLTLEARVEAEEDFAHAARAELCDDLIGPDRRPKHGS